MELNNYINSNSGKANINLGKAMQNTASIDEILKNKEAEVKCIVEEFNKGNIERCSAIEKLKSIGVESEFLEANGITTFIFNGSVYVLKSKDCHEEEPKTGIDTVSLFVQGYNMPIISSLNQQSQTSFGNTVNIDSGNHETQAVSGGVELNVESDDDSVTGLSNNNTRYSYSDLPDVNIVDPLGDSMEITGSRIVEKKRF